MVPCKYCDENLLLKKLGRCDSCLWLSLMLGAGSAIIWILLRSNQADAVQQVAALFAAGAGIALFIVHLLFGVYYRVTGQEGIFSLPAKPEK